MLRRVTVVSLLAKKPQAAYTIQKAFLKNPLPSARVRGVKERRGSGQPRDEQFAEPRDEQFAEQRFPENISWPEEIKWMNVGMHRKAYKEYNPPADVADQVMNVWTNVVGGDAAPETPVGDLNTKFQLLTACEERLGHCVPNDLLHQVQTLQDVITFYSTPISIADPLQKLTEQSLPKNMHVITEYDRFHPETDTRFGGISAFPRSSTIVSGLLTKKKYEGHVAKKSWPFK